MEFPIIATPHTTTMCFTLRKVHTSLEYIKLYCTVLRHTHCMTLSDTIHGLPHNALQHSGAHDIARNYIRLSHIPPHGVVLHDNAFDPMTPHDKVPWQHTMSCCITLRNVTYHYPLSSCVASKINCASRPLFYLTTHSIAWPKTDCHDIAWYCTVCHQAEMHRIATRSHYSYNCAVSRDISCNSMARRKQ